MLLRRWGGFAALTLLAAVPQAFAPPAEAGLPRIFRRREEPKPPVVLLAEQIDELEKSLNDTGTIVAKKPDVWGESRLTKHRRQVEEQLEKKLTEFELLLNGSVSRSDEAYFANALAIQAALSPGVPIPSYAPGGFTVPTGKDSNFVIQNSAGFLPGTVQSKTVNADGSVTTTIATDPIFAGTKPGEIKVNTTLNEDAENLGFRKGISLEPTIQLDQLKRYLDHLNELRRLNEGGDTSDAPGYALNLVRIPVSILPGEETRQGHGAEITVTAETHLTPELLPSTFRTLVIEDLLDVLSLPVRKSLDALPERERQEQAVAFLDGRIDVLVGTIAEAERQIVETSVELAEAERQLAEIQPQTQAVEALYALRRAVEAEETAGGVLDSTLERTREAIRPFWDPAPETLPSEPRPVPKSSEIAKADLAPTFYALPADLRGKFPPPMMDSEVPPAPDDLVRAVRNRQAAFGLEELRERSAKEEVRAKEAEANVEALKSQITLLQRQKDALGGQKQRLADQKAAAESSRSQLLASVSTAFRPSSPTRRSRLPIAPTQIVEAFGASNLFEVAKAFQGARDDRCDAGTIHVTEVQAFLRDELEAAYDYLVAPDRGGCWEQIPEIARAVRSDIDLATMRDHFVVQRETSIAPETYSVPRPTIISSLAWAILVESALLNERLNEDMVRVSGDPGCNCGFGGPYCFFGPDPPVEARHAFMEYVRCRWPIHVFALDPVNQEQNIDDAFAMRRELQLAAAVALATGQAGISETMRFVRRIEIEQRTIALNRTDVAFAHGANTFGWRFQPRFQTAEIESNSTVLFRDLLAGGPQRDHLIRDYRIEPGMRECVAIVVMPSFVPHVRFDIRSNWFELTDPDDTESSMTETVGLSRKIRNMERLAEVCSVEADSYRAGETDRLLARVKQLSDRMPLQTVHAQVPYENTTGGFELFSSGVTDLSPELIDFYGAPGVRLDVPTQLFLVGKNFSVHETEVIVGNTKVETTLLSRDVMRVDVPAGVQAVVCRRSAAAKDNPCTACRPGLPCGADCYEAVEVHLATPYGVSGKLIIPVVPTRSAAEAAAAAVISHQNVFHPVSFDWAATKVGGCVCYDEASHLLEHFCLQGDVAVTAVNAGSPFGAPPVLEFAATLSVEIDGEDVTLGKTPTIPLTFDKDLKGWPLAANGCVTGSAAPDACAFVQCVRDLLHASDGAYGAKAVTVRGFVRQPGGELAGVRLVNDLVITLLPCAASPCLGTSACPSCRPAGVVERRETRPGSIEALPVSIQTADPSVSEGVIALEAGPAFSAQGDESLFTDALPLLPTGPGQVPLIATEVVAPAAPPSAAAATAVAAPTGGLFPPTIVIQNQQPSMPLPAAEPAPPRRHRGFMGRLFHRN